MCKFKVYQIGKGQFRDSSRDGEFIILCMEQRAFCAYFRERKEAQEICDTLNRYKETERKYIESIKDK